MASCVNRKLLAGDGGGRSQRDLRSEIDVAAETEGAIMHVFNKACRCVLTCMILSSTSSLLLTSMSRSFSVARWTACL